jgi:hypothetical protein
VQPSGVALQKYLAVVPSPSTAQPALLDVDALGDRLPALRRCVTNLAEEPDVGLAPTHKPTDPPAAAVLALWLQGSDLDADALAGLLPWSAVVYPVGEQRPWSYHRDWPTGARSPGVKRLSFVRRRPELSMGEFATHWREVHAPLARLHHPALWSYNQNVVDGEPTSGAPLLSGVAELHFRSADDYRHQRYDSELGEETLRRDIEQFLMAGQSWNLWVGEYVLLE